MVKVLAFIVSHLTLNQDPELLTGQAARTNIIGPQGRSSIATPVRAWIKNYVKTSQRRRCGTTHRLRTSDAIECRPFGFEIDQDDRAHALTRVALECWSSFGPSHDRKSINSPVR